MGIHQSVNLSTGIVVPRPTTLLTNLVVSVLDLSTSTSAQSSVKPLSPTSKPKGEKGRRDRGHGPSNPLLVTSARDVSRPRPPPLSDSISLPVSFPSAQLVSRLQWSLELIDGDLLAANLRFNGHGTLLDNRVTEQQDLSLVLAGAGRLVELVALRISSKDDVSVGRDVELVGEASVKSETDSSRERFSDPGGSVGSDWLVKLGGADDLRLPNLDVDVVDTVSRSGWPHSQSEP